MYVPHPIDAEAATTEVGSVREENVVMPSALAAVTALARWCGLVGATMHFLE
jgi:hypothetical protein